MRTSRKGIINKIFNMVSSTGLVKQPIDIDVFSSSDLVTDLGCDSLDLINLFFQIEEEFALTITEEEIESCDLSKIENLAKIIEIKLGQENS